MYLKHYVCKSPYPYYIVRADEELTKFYVWSKTRMFNGWLYSEQEVMAMIESNIQEQKGFHGLIAVDLAKLLHEEFPTQPRNDLQWLGPYTEKPQETTKPRNFP